MGQVLSNILCCILCGEEAEDEPERPSETSKLLISPANCPVSQAKPSTNVSQLLPLQTRLSSSPTLGSCNYSGKSYVSNPPQLYWSNKSSDTEQNLPQNQSRDILISSSRKSYVSNPPQLYRSNKSSDTEQNRLQNQSRDILISSSSESYVLNPSRLNWSNKSRDTEQNRPQNQSRDILTSSLSKSYVSNPPRLNWSNNSRNTESNESYVSNPARLNCSNNSRNTKLNRIQNQPQDMLIYSSSSESSLDDDSSSDGGALQRDLLISLPWLKRSSFTDQKKQVIFPLLSKVGLKVARERDEEIEEEEEVSKAVVIEEKWMKHYSSCQKILLVGEGDFSFSASLAKAFGSATNIIATSLNSEGYLSRNYRNAMSNIQSLRSRGAKVMHDVDATEMANLFLFEGKTFDRIVYNFPHAGFIDNESEESQLWRNQKLVRLFMANAKRMITKDGEIHVTHKSNPYFFKWNLRQLGSSEGLRLIKEVHFNFRDYPGYNTKYGYRGDKNFNCNPSKTYKFELQIRGYSPYA